MFRENIPSFTWCVVLKFSTLRRHASKVNLVSGVRGSNVSSNCSRAIETNYHKLRDNSAASIWLPSITSQINTPPTICILSFYDSGSSQDRVRIPVRRNRFHCWAIPVFGLRLRSLHGLIESRKFDLNAQRSFWKINGPVWTYLREKLHSNFANSGAQSELQ